MNRSIHTKAAVRGAVTAAGVFVLALILHGGVRAHRGCIVDTPLWEIVNAPGLGLGTVFPNERLAPERFGYPTPDGPARTTVSRTRWSPVGFVAWALGSYLAFGAGVGLVVGAARRRRSGERTDRR